MLLSFTEQVDVAVMFYICVQEVTGSNFGFITGSHE